MLTSSVWRRISRVLLPALALGLALLGQPALAASSRPSLTSTSQATGPLKPGGGPVQHDPRVYLIYWGPNWNSTDLAAQNLVTGVFKALAGTQYNNILSQYTDNNNAPNNYIHNDTQMAGFAVDLKTPFPTHPLLWADVVNEAVNVLNAQAAANQPWTIDSNTQVLILQEHDLAGYAAGDFGGACGKHTYLPSTYGYLVIGTVLYLPDIKGCTPNEGMPDVEAWVATHEYAEMATNPLADGSGWTAAGTPPAEIADLCSTNGPTPNASPDPKVVTQLWSNASNNCTTALGLDHTSPDNTFPFHGVHTVEDPILTEYQNHSGLGDPLAEQMPINGGQVSYFVGNPCTSGYVIPNNTGYGGGGLTSGAAIYYSSATGAHEVDGCNFYKYWHDRGGPGGTQGFPTSDVLVIPNGYVSYFAGNGCGSGTSGPYNSNSAIYGSGWGTYFVGGASTRNM